MITHVAVVPQAPLLVPQLVTGAVTDTAGVRNAAVDAARWLAAGTPRWMAVGADPVPAVFEPDHSGTFGGFGADVAVSLSATSARTSAAELPLPVLVAAWLRQQAAAAYVRVRLLSPTSTPQQCLDVGKGLHAEPESGLLVLGDGSNRHGPRAPGGYAEAAGPFDAAVADALATVDAATLLGIEHDVAGELGASGRVPWQIAAGVIDEGTWRGTVHYSAAPFGVGYHVATWQRVAR